MRKTVITVLFSGRHGGAELANCNVVQTASMFNLPADLSELKDRYEAGVKRLLLKQVRVIEQAENPGGTYVPFMSKRIWEYLHMTEDCCGVEALASMFWLGEAARASAHESSLVTRCDLAMSIFRFKLGSVAGVRS